MPGDPRSLRLVAVADFRGGAKGPPSRIPVDKDRFDEAFARIAPRLALRVADRVSGPAPLELALAPERLADLAPARIAAVVPALARLREARGVVESIARGEAPLSSFRARAADHLPPALLKAVADTLEAPAQAPASSETPRPAPPSAGGDVEAILSLVGSAAPDARRSVDALAGEIAGRRRRPASGAAGALEVLDAILAAQLDAILHAPALRALEATWRGLRLLVDRADFRAGIALELVAAGVDEAAAALDALAEGGEVDLVLADFAFDASARDLERATALAEAAERLQAPLVAALAPAFFGAGSWAELAKGRSPQALFDEAPHAGWRALRDRESARWLVLTANRLGLRAPYGPEGESPRDLAYREGEGGGLWGSAVWALGSVVARAFARTGACLQISGVQHALVPDLALVPGPDGKPAPVEGAFGTERRDDLEKIGLTVAHAYQRDVASFGAVRSFRRPERYTDLEARADAAQQTSLAYQLFASRVARALSQAVGELSGIGSAEAAAEALRESLVRDLSSAATPLDRDRIAVGTRPNPEDASLTDVTVRVAPDATLGGRPIHVMLRFPLRL